MAADLHTMAFGFRYLLRPKGALTVWYTLEGSVEVGPIELDQPAADKLGAMVEEAVGMFASRLPPQSPRLPNLRIISGTGCNAEEDAGESRGSTTDPSALRHVPK